MDSHDTHSDDEKASPAAPPAGASPRDITGTVPECGDAPRGAVGAPAAYRLYRRRFVGVVGIVLLNAVAAMPNPWYGPIANNVSSDFGFTLDQVNWLGNVLNLVFLPSSIVVPFVCKRFNIRITCYIATSILVLSAWIRYAGVARSLNRQSAYALMMVGQVLAGVAQPAFQVIGPLYSERWFDLKSRTTMTMLMSIANPIGSGLAQLISPLSGSPRSSILVLAVICTAVIPCALLVGNAPPTPPTYAASQPSPPFTSLVRAVLGREPTDRPTYMSLRERLDLAILTLNFGVLVGAVTSFAILTNQDLAPYGYSSDTSGFMGATLLLAGLVCALVTAPLFDRVLTHHLARTCHALCPALGALWLSLVWAVKENNTGGLFAIMALIGAGSVTLLPVALELAVEVTRNADGSAAVLWFAGNLMSITCVLSEGALRAGPDAHPPLNMRRALIFQGALVCGAVVTIAGLRGRQARREMDERVLREGVEMQVVEHDWEQGKGGSGSGEPKE
ncbi:MFS general substrate transporter [Phanerochaete sordida]|uniref:MFS general substrate transporter n=1 Tax=Phanerochaete sordida TaxID=48140 RepID=A0A9P3LBU9_9APHY|nr:MFS general substrate transporter [Phanerochaete sordida]